MPTRPPRKRVPIREQIARLEKALAEAEERAPIVRARWTELQAIVAETRDGRRSLFDAGAAIEEARRTKLWRLDGHRTLDAWLTAIGVPRSSSYKWRAIARAGEAATADATSMRAAYAKARAPAETQWVARRLERALRAIADHAEIRTTDATELTVSMETRAWRRVLEALGHRPRRW